MQKLHLLAVICLVKVALANPTEVATNSDNGSKYAAITKDEANSKVILNRAVIYSSNMPAEMQANAANLLNTAYEATSALGDRVSVFESMFTAVYPQYYWNVGANYQYIQYYYNYYIILGYQGDVILVFGLRKTC